MPASAADERWLSGLRVLVTGAAGVLGRALVAEADLRGARVVATGRRPSIDTAALPEAAFRVAADLRDPDDCRRVVHEAARHLGGLDIVVNNAGYTHRNKPMAEVTEDEFDRIFSVNVKAIFLSVRHATPYLQAKGGSILNIASTAGLRPRPGLTWYNASKGAVITATKSMAVELAPKIRVNCLCPVLGQTGLTSTFLGEDTPERRAQFLATIPLGRMSTPEDIANAALYLSSDEASMVTGVALEVDGGRCI